MQLNTICFVNTMAPSLEAPYTILANCIFTPLPRAIDCKQYWPISKFGFHLQPDQFKICTLLVRVHGTDPLVNADFLFDCLLIEKGNKVCRTNLDSVRSAAVNPWACSHGLLPQRTEEEEEDTS